MFASETKNRFRRSAAHKRTPSRLFPRATGSEQRRGHSDYGIFDRIFKRLVKIGIFASPTWFDADAWPIRNQAKRTEGSEFENAGLGATLRGRHSASYDVSGRNPKEADQGTEPHRRPMICPATGSFRCLAADQEIRSGDGPGTDSRRDRSPAPRRTSS